MFEIDGTALVITVLKVGNRERGPPINALPIRPIAKTADSVTPSRADFEILAELESDAQDLADADAVKTRLATGETDTFPFVVAERLLDGEHPVTVSREHRAFTVRGLAEAAGVSPSYLSEIEPGKKPGSFDAMAHLAAALRVPLALLVRA
ncbi:helix-turn-helix domain-containing protein [Skermanella stibiiresistens]|uniref:helix-turn-helix domain-containing protein n=1 Tax=Skermanella stibiiresistens TaxID=913326 RepID=UPI0004BC1647|nr:helix-turn-helix transcriptional regulator [Skermanella stibiiresistens]